MTMKPCKRVILAGAGGCRVIYCEDCQVAEIEVGAISLRLDTSALANMSQLLQEAQSRLAAMEMARSVSASAHDLRHVH